MSILHTEILHDEGKINGTKLCLEFLNIDNFIDGLFDIKIANVFPELTRAHLCKVKHVIDQKVENFCARCLNCDAF